MSLYCWRDLSRVVIRGVNGFEFDWEGFNLLFPLGKIAFDVRWKRISWLLSLFFYGYHRYILW